jgi:hypothetical protein
MTFIARVVCVAIAYAAVLSLLANPGIGAVMTALFFSLIFCGTFALVESVISRNAIVAFIITNIVLTVLGGIMQSGAAYNTSFSSYVGGQASWVGGRPTTLGIVHQAIFVLFCLLCNGIGLTMHIGLRRLVSRLRAS